jgi:hypothetical protein
MPRAPPAPKITEDECPDSVAGSVPKAPALLSDRNGSRMPREFALQKQIAAMFLK